MTGSHMQRFQDDNFESRVLKSPTPVLVDFGAVWCPPCRAMRPHVDAVAQAFAGKLTVGELDVDENPVTSERYRVRSLPTVMLFKNGVPVDMIVGAVTRSRLEELVRKHLDRGGDDQPSVQR
ncbi:MAG: thioredoxin [Myxococcota bacterium]